MARERWFYAKDLQRIGPVPKRELVQSLLGLPDPRGCLVWRHGLPAWTPAREVPEIDNQLAPFVSAPAPPEPAPAVSVPTASAKPGAAAPVALHRGSARRAQSPGIALYFGGLGLLLVSVLVGWLAWPRTNGEGAQSPPANAARTKPAASAARAGAAGTSETAPAAPTTGFSGWSDEEVDLPAAELRRLRGVGAWSGQVLTITVYNGSAWRVTEIVVRTSVLRGDEFVDAATPQRMLPVGAAGVEAGTAGLLDKVAPDRKKPGVNPLDTGPFTATVGTQPSAYRWRIEAALGYPPRMGS